MEIKKIRINGRHMSLRITPSAEAETYLVQHDNNVLNVQIIKHDRLTKKIVYRVNGQQMTSFYSTVQSDSTCVSLYGIGAQYDVTALDESVSVLGPSLEAKHHQPHLASPLAGRIVRVLVVEGQQFTKGQALVVVESMKMENEICAQHDGFIKTVSIQVGNVVRSGQSLMEFVFDREDGHDAEHKSVEKTFEHR